MTEHVEKETLLISTDTEYTIANTRLVSQLVNELFIAGIQIPKCRKQSILFELKRKEREQWKFKFLLDSRYHINLLST